MLFTSYNFIIFICLLFLAYYLIPKKYQYILLLGASYLFYAIAEPKYIIYILTTTISTYLVSRKINNLELTQATELTRFKDALNKEEKKTLRANIKAKKWKWLLLCLCLNFGILAVVKYANFSIRNLNYLLQAAGSERQLSFLEIALPMGISFYTFQAMGYIIDVYRGKYSPEQNILKLALFISFFPQLVQGPISRYDDLSKTLFKEHSVNFANIKYGSQRILWGFFKKLVIADRLLPAVNILIRNPDEYQGIFVLIGMIFYAIQLYADFTGGIDITIGIGEVLGVKIKENFNAPFLATSIAEYWRRWHISMGSWFRDYVFYPLSVSKPMIKFTKYSRRIFGPEFGKRVPVYISTTVVWFVTGIWHGASWNFIVWGLMNGAVIIVSQEFTPFYQWFHRKVSVKDTVAFRSFQVVRTFLLMSSLRLLDCYRDVPTTFRMFGTMFTNLNIGQVRNGALLNLGLSISDYFILMGSLLILIGSCIVKRKGSIRDWLAQKPLIVECLVYYLIIIAIVLLGAYGVGYDSSQFIYNQF